MADPNQRSRKQKSSPKGYPAPKGSAAPKRPLSSAQRGYYDANGLFHPLAAASPSRNLQESGNRNRAKAKASRRRSFLFAKIVLLALLCLAAGLVWHNISGSKGTDIAGKANSTRNSSPANQLVVTPAHTENIISYAELITYSSDTSKPLYGKVIILDPGHGGTDSGCVYPTSDPQYIESNINLSIAESTKEALESQGATVIMLRTDDSWISLYRRIAITHLNCLQFANEIGSTAISASDKARLISELTDTITINSDTVDTGGMGIMVGTGVGADLKLLMDLETDFKNILFLSIHINSNPASSLHGTQVYYVTDESIIESEKRMVAEDSAYTNNANFPLRADYYGRDGSRNQNLAQALYDSITKSSPQMKSNTKTVLADNYAVLRENNLAGALIEVGFITNKKDRSYITDSATTSKIAKGIAAGCVNFFADDT